MGPHGRITSKQSEPLIRDFRAVTMSFPAICLRFIFSELDVRIYWDTLLYAASRRLVALARSWPVLLIMARSWIIDGRGIARKVKNASQPATDQIKDCGATRECPNCHYHIDNSDVSLEWPGLPAGVKFDPSDVELLENLAAKCEVGNLKPHLLIDEFIQTVEGDDGVCYTHPENLPGAKKDGSCAYFFYRITNAYTSGQRKRRRISNQDTRKAQVRWHKTGRTTRVTQNGIPKGFKKILVLYAASKLGSKSEKCNWVMHQYHLGTAEDERDGEYVVSKIFYQQPKELGKNRISLEAEDLDAVQVIPRTPKTNIPLPPRLENTPSSGCGADYYPMASPVQESEHLKWPCNPLCNSQLKDEMEYATSLDGDSDTIIGGVDSLFCHEIIDNFSAFSESNLNGVTSTEIGSYTRGVSHEGCNPTSAIDDLYNIELDTPPDFLLGDLQFASQDNVFEWLDRL